MRFYIIILILFISPFVSYSFQKTQLLNDSTEIKTALSLIEKGKKLGYQNKRDSSENCFKDAKIIFKKNGDSNSYAKTLYYESLFLRKYYELDNMIEKFDSLIDLSNSLVKNNIYVAKLIERKGLELKSLDYYQRSIIEYQKAYKYTKNLNDINYEIMLCLRLARVYRDVADLNKSLEYVAKIKRLMKLVPFDEMTYAYYSLIELEICYKRNQFEKVDSLSRITLQLFKKNDHLFGTLGSYQYLGMAALHSNKPQKSLFWFTKCLNFFYEKSQEMGNYKNLFEADYHILIGDAFLKLTNFKRALEYYYTASKLYNNYSIIELSLGNAYLKMSMFDSALYYYHKGMYGLANNFTTSDIYSNPSINNILIKKELLKHLKGKSIAFYLKYNYSKIKNIKDLNASLQNGILAFDLIDLWLNDFASSGSKLDYGDFVKPIYEQAILTSLTLEEVSKNASYKEKAFNILERNKAGVLFNDLKLHSGKKFSNIPDSLLTKEENIKTNLSYYNSQLRKQEAKKEKQDSVKVSRYQDKIFTLNREREGLEALLENKYSKYHQLKYSKDSIVVADLQQNILDDKTTLIEYFTGDSAIYAFIINKNRFEVKTLPVIDSLEQKVKSLPNYLKKKNKLAFSNTSYKLYQQLIEPLNIPSGEPNYSNLIIIPDGALWQLNFDLLLSQKPEKLDYRKFQYLIKDYTISYAYSAKLLKQDLGQKVKPPKNEVLAFSYNNPDDISVGNYIAMRGFRDSNLGDLPGTRKEIKAISSVVDGSYYFGSYANEKNFKENAKDYQILHLALHGVIDNEEPMNSKLYFTRNGGSQDKDSLEDNYLHAFELYNLELNAELAVLSACNTGSGKLIKGEGIMSLGRAFTYAGCKSLLLSQWEVSDAFTPDLMKDFYQNLKEGKSKAAALREAKLAHLAKADNLTSNPYFWAPMVQLGDNRPLKNDNYWYWVAGIIGLVVVVGLVVYFKKNLKTSEV